MGAKWDFVKTSLKTGGKWGGIAGLVAGAAVGIPLIVSGMRSRRRFDEDRDLLPSRELTDPLPPVLDFTPQGPAQPGTLMGEAPVEGAMARKVKMQRAGISAGIDATAPSIMSPDGRNTVDGSRSVEVLGAPAARTL